MTMVRDPGANSNQQVSPFSTLTAGLKWVVLAPFRLFADWVFCSIVALVYVQKALLLAVGYCLYGAATALNSVAWMVIYWAERSTK